MPDDLHYARCIMLPGSVGYDACHSNDQKKIEELKAELEARKDEYLRRGNIMMAKRDAAWKERDRAFALLRRCQAWFDEELDANRPEPLYEDINEMLR